MIFLLTYPKMYGILTRQLGNWEVSKVENEKLNISIKGYQKLTLLDYPGKVACTVFTGGCNLRCPFCHNAGIVKDPTATDEVQNELLSYLSKRKGILDGVCVTGGEPLLQPHLLEFLSKLKEMGYSVKLDTNGSLPEKLSTILDAGLVDYVAMDIKSSPEGYEKASGSEIPFTIFAKSMEIIRSSGVEYEFRTTAAKGIHEISDFEKISFLLHPDEQYFIQCFVDSGNILSDICSPFDSDELKKILEKVKKRVPRAALRGKE